MRSCCWGAMNWPIDPDWRCEFCGEVSLLWALPNGECHCQKCHAVYSMRDEEKILTAPISCIKKEYGESWKRLPEPRKSMNEMTKEDWKSAMGVFQAEGRQ